MTCFVVVFFHNCEIFFFSYMIQCAKWICAHTGSIMLLRTCKLLSIQQSEKLCFPMSLSSSSPRNIICHSDLHLQARNSFFEWGLFPSRASISVIVWGVIWDKICKEEGTMAISLKCNLSLLTLYFAGKVTFLLVQTTTTWYIRQNYWWWRNKGRRKFTRRAPRFSSSWSVVETPRSTELTPSLRRHQAARWEKTSQTESVKTKKPNLTFQSSFHVLWLN